MPRTRPVEPEGAPRESRSLIEQGKKATGGEVINFYRQMAVAPKPFKAYLDFSGVLQRGSLDRKTQEAIAVAVSDYHGCKY